jgi:hypothetical protein
MALLGPFNWDPVVVLDGTTVICIYQTALAGDNAISELRNFDTTTDTWGAPYGSVGAPPMLTCVGMYRRSTGEIVVCSDFITPNGETVRQATPVNAGVWGASVDLTAPDGSSSGVPESFRAVMDTATDTLHCFIQTGFPGTLAYVQFLALNILGFSASIAAQANVTVTPGRPVIWNGNLVVPYLNMDLGSSPQQCWIGTPLINPVWTLIPAVDPNFPVDLTLQVTDAHSGWATVDNGVLSIAYEVDTGVRVIQTIDPSPFLGWIGSTVFPITAPDHKYNPVSYGA